MKPLIIAIALLAASSAFAQQTPADRVTSQLGSVVGQQMTVIETQKDTIAQLQDQLAKAQARIKELDPKKDDPK